MVTSLRDGVRIKIYERKSRHRFAHGFATGAEFDRQLLSATYGVRRGGSRGLEAERGGRGGSLLPRWFPRIAGKLMLLASARLGLQCWSLDCPPFELSRCCLGLPHRAHQLGSKREEVELASLLQAQAWN